MRGPTERRRYRGSLDLKAEGVRPCLLIEVVSPLYRHHDDESKVEIYQRAGADPGAGKAVDAGAGNGPP